MKGDIGHGLIYARGCFFFMQKSLKVSLFLLKVCASGWYRMYLSKWDFSEKCEKSIIEVSQKSHFYRLFALEANIISSLCCPKYRKLCCPKYRKLHLFQGRNYLFLKNNSAHFLSLFLGTHCPAYGPSVPVSWSSCARLLVLLCPSLGPFLPISWLLFAHVVSW